MGNLFTALVDLFSGKTEKSILMVGLDAAGKTTILYKLKLGEVVTTMPTIGFNVEQVEYKKVNFTVWDVGGQDKIRPLWRHYYQSVGGIIFVVDSNDRERIMRDSEAPVMKRGNEESKTAAEELIYLMTEDELRGVPVLVLANKQDLPHSMSVQEVTSKLGIEKVQDKGWYVQGTCATTGDGLYEGLDWLVQASQAKEE